jgi:hypothetical protein
MGVQLSAKGFTNAAIHGIVKGLDKISTAATTNI